MLRRNLAGLAFWLLLCFAAAGIGAIASRDAPQFYLALARPEWAPPASVFGPVWTVLYALNGLSAWLVWREREPRSKRTAYALFVAQLATNALWSWLFFELKLGAWAFAEVLVLAALVAATMVKFHAIKPLAAWLLAPYLAWIAYASALTLAVWRLNPGLL
jgi:tryptophan-rich sensory protein